MSTTVQGELIAVTDKEMASKAAKLNLIAQESGLTLSGTPGFLEGLKMASAIGQMRQMLDENMMAPVMELMNSPLGFRTDKDPAQIDRSTGKPNKPYALSVVREAVIEGMIRGVPPVGNCMNIIAGRFYVTKEGFIYLLKKEELGVTDLQRSLEVPKLQGEGAVVAAKATWKKDGKPQELTRTIPIRVNKSMGIDAILGKAERKLLAAVHAQVTGSEISDGDATDTPMRDVTTKSEGRRSAASKTTEENTNGEGVE